MIRNKKYFIPNLILIVISTFLFWYFKKDGYFTAVQFSVQSILISYILLPLLIMITIYGLGHSLIDIKWKEWKKEWWKMLSIPNIILEFFITIFVGDIYIKFATGALILMTTIPLVITLIIIIFAIKDDLVNKKPYSNFKNYSI